MPGAINTVSPFAAAAGPFVHGFTWSHNGLGAAVGSAVIARLRAGLLDRSRELGARILADLRDALTDDPSVGEVRGLGTMIGIELVADRASKAPFPRGERRTERVVAAARERELLLYSSTGHVDGDGDLLMFGPPFTISDAEIATAVERTAEAIAEVTAPA